MAANLRKRRRIVRSSITRLVGRVTELEGIANQPHTTEHAQQLLEKQTDFKDIQLQMVDLIAEDDETSLATEQEAIDKFDADVASLTVRLQALLRTPTAPEEGRTGATDERVLNRKFRRIEAGLTRIIEALTPAVPDEGIPPPEDAVVEVELTQLGQYQEELRDFKRDLAALYEEIAAMDIPDDHELLRTHAALERRLSRSSHKVKQHIPMGTTTAAGPDSRGIKLPKLDVPTFDGNIVHWKGFWEQFSVAVHSKSNLFNAEKTVYLQNAIKDGAAKNAIEGLSHSGDNYEKAIDTLKSRYDRPRLIQRTH